MPEKQVGPSWRDIREGLEWCEEQWGGAFVVEAISLEGTGNGRAHGMYWRVIWRKRLGQHVVDFRAAGERWEDRQHATVPSLLHALTCRLIQRLEQEMHPRAERVSGRRPAEAPDI